MCKKVFYLLDWKYRAATYLIESNVEVPFIIEPSGGYYTRRRHCQL